MFKFLIDRIKPEYEQFKLICTIIIYQNFMIIICEMF